MSSPFFSDALKSLIGYSVGVFSNDGTLMKGTMVDVKKDYLIVQTTEEKYIYHHLAQVKSVSKNSKAVQANVIAKDYLQAEQLKEILEQCKYSWVTVNCYNDQFVMGFLSRVFDDHLILISGEEKIIMQNACIINIFPGVYEPEDEETNEPEEKELSSQVEVRDEITESEAPAEDREEQEKPEEKELSFQVEVRDEITEIEASVEDREEQEKPEEKELSFQVEVRDEITEIEASVEDREEQEKPEEKELSFQVEVRDEITEIEASVEGKEKQEKPEEKELSFQVEVQNEITEIEAPVEGKEKQEKPEEKELFSQVEVRDEITEIEAPVEGKEEQEKPEEKELSFQVEVQNEITESEAPVEGKEEQEKPEEKELFSQVEVRDEITESEAPAEDREEQEKLEEKELSSQVEVQNEITESGSPRDNQKTELEKQRTDPLKQIKKAKYTIKRQITAGRSDKEVVTGEKVTTDILAVKTRENIPRNSLEDPFHDTQSQKRKNTKSIKAEKGKSTDSIIDESCTPPPLEIMAEEKQEVWLPVMTSEEIEKQLERQYYSLMKQAEKKYKALREKRMGRKMMKK